MTRDSGFDSTNFVARLQPDLVLLDINMPFLSGDRLFEIFRGHRLVKDVPIVFFSSNDENALRRMVRETGALGYIPKSEMGMSFATKVAGFIERSKPGA
jgi:DNA-binding NarL/FixJ family response regulator